MNLLKTMGSNLTGNLELMGVCAVMGMGFKLGDMAMRSVMLSIGEWDAKRYSKKNNLPEPTAYETLDLDTTLAEIFFN
jgi:hypothetical protein